MNIHLQKYNEYKYVFDAIQAGSLQHVVKLIDGNLSYTLHSNVQKIVKLFNKLCIEILSNSPCFNHSFYVYRALFNIPDNISELVHPIPFSTTLSLKFAQEWLYRKTYGRVILRFLLTADNAYVRIDQDDEREVILPSGTIYINSLDYTIDDTRYYTCTFRDYLCKK